VSHSSLGIPRAPVEGERVDAIERDEDRRALDAIAACVARGLVSCMPSRCVAAQLAEIYELRADLASGAALTCCRERLRAAVSYAAGSLSAAAAQSPAGGVAYDYLRDRHEVGERWEERWVASLPTRRPLRGLMTSCGMAAVATVLAHTDAAHGRIVVDAGVYHETRHLMASGPSAGRVVVIANPDWHQVMAVLRPSVVFVDAVTNRPDVRIADLVTLADASHLLDPPPIVVVDATVCSMTDPWIWPACDRMAGPVLVVESLTKHAQLGLDRIPGGVIVTDPATAVAIDSRREHLGTNISDLACRAMPPLLPAVLLRRLHRQTANAALLAQALADEGVQVAHPSQPGHPDHQRWLGDGVDCGIMAIDVPSDFVDRAAALPGVDLGVGFGFDRTRICATTQSVPEASAFVRIAAGTEPVDDARRLAARLVELATRRSGAPPARGRRRPASSTRPPDH
jgi:cystathionine beta-lyase/cystathionine gamma-synthase